jgi:plastocyanin
MTSGLTFSPSNLTIPVGDSVRVHNSDTSGPHTFSDPPAFNSGDVAPGASYSYHFTTAGTYNFFCSYHQAYGMKGTITVN